MSWHRAIRMAVNPDILNTLLGRAPAPLAAGPLSLSPDGTELRIRGGPPIAFRSEPQINAIRLLVEAYYKNERLPASKLTHLGSLNRVFGKAKWALLQPHLKSVARTWKFDV